MAVTLCCHIQDIWIVIQLQFFSFSFSSNVWIFPFVGHSVPTLPSCMPGSLTSGFLWNQWRGKRSRHSRRMRNPQFYVSGKRPMYLYPVIIKCNGQWGEVTNRRTQLSSVMTHRSKTNCWIMLNIIYGMRQFWTNQEIWHLLCERRSPFRFHNVVRCTIGSHRPVPCESNDFRNRVVSVQGTRILANPNCCCWWWDFRFTVWIQEFFCIFFSDIGCSVDTFG